MTIFHAGDWISLRTVGGERLSQRAKEAVQSFTLMWNIFEGTVCNAKAGINSFEKISKESKWVSNWSALSDLFDFYRNRYTMKNSTNECFDGLRIRRQIVKERVAKALINKNTDVESRVFALLMILYRLRNNLFHGLKSIDMLNDQAENLEIASKGLSLFIEYSNERLIKIVA